MKKIILIALSVLTINFVNAQVDTTISMRLKKIELNNEVIKSNLKKCHNQWKDGLGVTIFGFGTSIIGSYMSLNANNIGDKSNVGIIITSIGGITSLIGTIVMLDSHKYIGRAGLNIESNGLVYRFN